MSKSDTPETDAAEWYVGYTPVVRASFASGLERQRDELAATLRFIVRLADAAPFETVASTIQSTDARGILARLEEGGVIDAEKLAREAAAREDKWRHLADALERANNLDLELRAAMEDAARWRWWRANVEFRSDPKMDGNHHWWHCQIRAQLRGPTIEAAIDAARKEGA